MSLSGPVCVCTYPYVCKCGRLPVGPVRHGQAQDGAGSSRQFTHIPHTGATYWFMLSASELEMRPSVMHVRSQGCAHRWYTAPSIHVFWK